MILNHNEYLKAHLKSQRDKLPAKMEAEVDTLCFLAQPKGQQQIGKQKITRTARKSTLYESVTTKELKKKHSCRLVGGEEMGSRGREDMQQGCGWRTGQVRQWLADSWSHICMQINQEEQLGSEIDHTTQGSSTGI